jgi:hypothetical protein
MERIWGSGAPYLTPNITQPMNSYTIPFSSSYVFPSERAEEARRIISSGGRLPDNIPHRYYGSPRGFVGEGETMIATRYDGRFSQRTEVVGPFDMISPNPRGVFGTAKITPLP